MSQPKFVKSVRPGVSYRGGPGADRFVNHTGPTTTYAVKHGINYATLEVGGSYRIQDLSNDPAKDLQKDEHGQGYLWDEHTYEPPMVTRFYSSKDTPAHIKASLFALAHADHPGGLAAPSDMNRYSAPLARRMIHKGLLSLPPDMPKHELDEMIKYRENPYGEYDPEAGHAFYNAHEESAIDFEHIENEIENPQEHLSTYVPRAHYSHIPQEEASGALEQLKSAMNPNRSIQFDHVADDHQMTLEEASQSK